MYHGDVRSLHRQCPASSADCWIATDLTVREEPDEEEEEDEGEGDGDDEDGDDNNGDGYSE